MGSWFLATWTGNKKKQTNKKRVTSDSTYDPFFGYSPKGAVFNVVLQ